MKQTDGSAVKNIPMVHCWMGTPVSELDKEQLLEVINILSEDLESLRRERSKMHAHVDWLSYLRSA